MKGPDVLVTLTKKVSVPEDIVRAVATDFLEFLDREGVEVGTDEGKPYSEVVEDYIENLNPNSHDEHSYPMITATLA